MRDVWRINKDRSDLLQAEIEARHVGKNLLFHGTSKSNAISIMNGMHNRVPKSQLAEELCNKFDTTLASVLKDEVRKKDILYTAVTRARNVLVICGSKEEITQAGGKEFFKKLHSPPLRRL